MVAIEERTAYILKSTIRKDVTSVGCPFFYLNTITSSCPFFYSNQISSRLVWKTNKHPNKK